MSSTARLYCLRFFRLRQSSSVSFHTRNGSSRRRSNRRNCSASEMCIQNFTRIMPSATSDCSNSTISSVGTRPLLLGGEALDPLDEHAAVPRAVEHGHPAPAPGARARSARGNGAAWRRASAPRTARRARGGDRAVPTSRLIAPPLPDASHPSNTTHNGGPMPPSPTRPPSTRRSCSSRRWARSSRSASSRRDELQPEVELRQHRFSAGAGRRSVWRSMTSRPTGSGSQPWSCSHTKSHLASASRVTVGAVASEAIHGVLLPARS